MKEGHSFKLSGYLSCLTLMLVGLLVVNLGEGFNLRQERFSLDARRMAT